MFYPGETVRLLRDVPEAGLAKGAKAEVAGLAMNDQGIAVAAEVRHYAGSDALAATIPVEALERVLSTSTEQRTAVLWDLEKSGPAAGFMRAAIECLLNRDIPMSPGLSVARLHYHRDERWWKRDEPFSRAEGMNIEAIARDWDGLVIGFSGRECFHLEFRLKGRGEAVLLLHEREEAFAGQVRRAAPATELSRLLAELFEAAGARFCAFPVADAWLMDEDWPSLLQKPCYPDFFLFRKPAYPAGLPGPFRIAGLGEGGIMATTLPVKFSPDYDPAEPGERDLKLAALRKCHALGEKYYDQLYNSRLSKTGLYSDIKDSFLGAIAAANALGLQAEAAALDQRLENIKAVFRSQFS